LKSAGDPYAMNPVASAGLISKEDPRMQGESIWKSTFRNWPEAIPRRGVVVNNLGEQLPFKAFMLRPDMILLERTNPDTSNARYLMVPYDTISLVKFIDPLGTKAFATYGFEGALTT
jgi:hypothetical protein